MLSLQLHFQLQLQLQFHFTISTTISTTITIRWQMTTSRFGKKGPNFKMTLLRLHDHQTLFDSYILRVCVCVCVFASSTNVSKFYHTNYSWPPEPSVSFPWVGLLRKKTMMLILPVTYSLPSCLSAGFVSLLESDTINSSAFVILSDSVAGEESKIE